MVAPVMATPWRPPHDAPSARLTSLSLTSAQWRDFVERQAAATAFHHPAWASFLAACYGFRPFAFARIAPNGTVEGGLPFIEVGGPIGGKRWLALPFTDHCRPLATNSDAVGALVEQLAPQQDGVINEIAVRAPLPPHPSFHSHVAAVLHTLDLSPSINRVHDRFSKMHQRNVRKATQSGLRVEFDQSLLGMRRYYRLHVLTRRRQGVPSQSWRFFRLLWERLIVPGLGTVLLTYHGDVCIAGAVFLHWNGTFIYKYGASDLAHAENRPNHLLFWTAIQHACAQGYHTFDWGRTDLDNDGLRAFKSGWGATEEPLVYTSTDDRLQAGRLATLRPTVQRTMATAIRRGPPWLGQFAGMLLYKYAT